MKITPLVYLCAFRVPALTDLFSDNVPIASMAVVSSGNITLTASAPHGVAIGAQQGVCVVDALTPNPITALSQIGDGSNQILVTVAYPHALTTTPDAALYAPWNLVAFLNGIGVSLLQGNVQLVAVPTQMTLVVQPGALVALPGSIPAGAALLERLDREIIGWHAATATSPTALTFPTPATVTRNYTVNSPKVVKNIRVWGAVDLTHALSHFTRGDEANATVLNQSYMFVMPHGQARLSRNRESRTDLATENTPQTDIREMLIDGIEIIVVLPAERYGGAVACMDRCQGQVFTAMLQTFNGLKIPRSELFSNGSDYVLFLSDHGVVQYDRANYVHSYRFEAGSQLTSQDCVLPFQIPDISAIDIAIQGGNTIPTTTIQAFGSVPFNGIVFSPGIGQDDGPGLLTASITLPSS